MSCLQAYTDVTDVETVIIIGMKRCGFLAEIVVDFGVEPKDIVVAFVEQKINHIFGSLTNL